jgi:UDP-N-acetylglucosamine 2-epimerase (non-hydrolysing)
MSKPVVVFVVGTRPDSIKTLPVVMKMKEESDFETVLISTGQHKEMLQQVFDTFGVQPDHDLALMKHGQGLTELSGRMTLALGELVEKINPSFMVAQGDTTTTFISSLVAFYQGIPFGHVEAGLRTHNISDPFPEEFNRVATSLIAAQHYAPTDLSASNLRREHVSDDRIFITGNTGIDAVMQIAHREPQTWFPDHKGRVILMTMHRRENWGEPMRGCAIAARTLIEEQDDCILVVAMHRNPVVREVLEAELGGHERIHLIEPPEYAQFTKLVQRSYLILTDSGGVQEEAPSFGIPILVLRNTTERPEGVDAGCATLVGTNPQLLLNEARLLLNNAEKYAAMSQVSSPYGDGEASTKIVGHIRDFLSSKITT